MRCPQCGYDYIREIVKPTAYWECFGCLHTFSMPWDNEPRSERKPEVKSYENEQSTKPLIKPPIKHRRID